MAKNYQDTLEMFAQTASERHSELIHRLSRMAGGETHLRLPISHVGDDLDAIAYGINILAEELTYALCNLNQERERAERANRAKTDFLAHMSHEIRTPLMAIAGFCELIDRSECDVIMTREFVTRIRDNCASLRKLTDQVLDLAKVESGELSLEMAPVAIRPLLTEAVRALESCANVKGLKVECVIDEAVPCTVSIDPLRLCQVVNNLMSNAIKFSEAGTVRLVCSIMNRDRIAIDVSDEGLGISPDQRMRLFKPFSQGDSGISRKFGGTGLGLNLTRSLCRAMGGDLIIKESRLGSGSVFRATMRFSPTVRVAPLQPKATSPNSLPLMGTKILLVDDSRDIQEVVRFFLTKAGCDFHFASSGKEALNIANDSFQLILMDIQMPEMDGVETTRRLREAGYKGPIVAFTAHAMNHEKQECLKAGFDDYIAKPVDWDSFISRILPHIH